MRRMLILTVTAVVLGTSVAAANSSPRAPSGYPAAVQATGSAAETEASVPVPPPSDKAVRYYWSGNMLWFANLAWGLAVPCLFLFTGLSARIRDWSRKLGRKWFFVVGIYS